MTSTLSEKGQIVIPQGVRVRQGFHPGDDFTIHEEPGAVTFKKIPQRRNKGLADLLYSCPHKGWFTPPVRDPNNSRNK